MNPAAAAEPLLELRNIRKRFDSQEVLKGIDLSIRPGEFHALIGENGAGKSTLLNILFGMPVIARTGGYEGEIRFAGRPVVLRSPHDAMALGMGMVHQEFSLIDGFTASENIKLNREPESRGWWNAPWRGPLRSLRTIDRPGARAAARKVLADLGLSLPDDPPVGDLPVGHRQFVEIARELDREKVRLLIFDEPTAVLNEREAEAFLQAACVLNRAGIAILFITHRLEEVLRAAHRVTVLRDGETALSSPVEGCTVDQLAEAMCGRKVGGPADAPAGRAASPPGAGAIHLAFEDFSVDMPGEKVAGLDLAILRGEILGIGGLAGQGKAGIANGLFGLFPSTGKVRLLGEPLPVGKPAQLIRRGLAFLSEDRRNVGLLLEETLALNMAAPALLAQRRLLRGRRLGPLAVPDRNAMRENALRWIEELDIRCQGPRDLPIRLSGGNQQKVALARVLGLEPEILFIAEPTRGIDVGAKERILRYLRRLNAERGTTVIVISSEMEELRQSCHRIAIISEGRTAGILPGSAPAKDFALLMTGEEAAVR